MFGLIRLRIKANDSQMNTLILSEINHVRMGQGRSV